MNRVRSLQWWCLLVVASGLAVFVSHQAIAARGKRIPTDDAEQWQEEPFLGCGMLGQKILQGPGLQAGMPRGKLVFNPDGSAFLITSRSIFFVQANRTVRLLAGRPGLGGFQDGPASVARFSTINGAVRGGRGDLYINDRGNVCIRRLYQRNDGSWHVQTIAGVPGRKGRKDGPAREALFQDPCNLSINSQGELFALDKDYIRRIAAGEVTTLNPEGGTGFQDGPIESAMFSLIMGAGACCDGYDNLMIADRWNNRFRKVDVKAGQVSTYAGSGQRAHHEDGTYQECAVEAGSITWDPKRKSYYVNMVDSNDLGRLEEGWLKTVIWDCKMAGLDFEGNIYSYVSTYRRGRYRFNKYVLRPGAKKGDR